MWLLQRTQSFERDDRVVSDVSQSNRAGSRQLSADQCGAGTALPEAAAKLRTVQSKIVPQHIQQRRLRRRRNLMRHPVNGKSECHTSPAELEAVWRSSAPKARSTLSGPA